MGAQSAGTSCQVSIAMIIIYHRDSMLTSYLYNVTSSRETLWWCMYGVAWNTTSLLIMYKIDRYLQIFLIEVVQDRERWSLLVTKIKAPVLMESAFI